MSDHYVDREFMIFNVSELNKINFNEVLETSEDTVRISVDLEMGNPNFNLYKFQKVQIIFSNEKNTPSNSDQTQARLSGEWMIIDISYNCTESTISTLSIFS